MRILPAIAIVSITISSLAQSKPNFTIKGVVKNGYAYKILLRYKSDDQSNLGIDVEDVAIVHNDVFSFTGFIHEPVQAYLVIDGNSSYAPIYLDTGKINVDVTVTRINDFVHPMEKIETTSIKGSYSDSLQHEFYGHAKKIMRSDDPDSVKSNNLFKTLLKFVQQHPNHNLSSEFLKYAYPLTYNQAKIIYNNLSPVQQSKALRNGVSDFLRRTQKLQSNYVFIAQPDTLGTLVSGKELGYNYMLIHFWASWAKHENANLIELYKKYNKKGFEILGVSIDKEKTEWTKAIVDDKLMWPQISDLKGNKNELYNYYAIPHVPFNFIIDRKGKVVSVGLYGKELKKKIEQLFP